MSPAILFPAIAFVVVLVLGALFGGPARSLDLGRPFDFAQGRHGQGHAQHHDWYQELKQPGTGYSCCNGTVNGPNGAVVEGDCRPTRAQLQEDGTWRALVDLGLSADDFATLERRLPPLKVSRAPVIEKPKGKSGAIWTRPEVLVEVAYPNKAADGRLRHPRFKGFRDDLEPKRPQRRKR